MTSSSRGNGRRGRLPWVAFGAALAVACVSAPASDVPAAALTTVRPVAAAPVQSPQERVQIREARATVVANDDPMVVRIVHPDDYGRLSAPVLVTADMARPFGDLSRTTSPVLVVGGTPITNTIVPGDSISRVHAVVLNGAELPAVLSVQVGWLGALEETISPPVQVQLAR